MAKMSLAILFLLGTCVQVAWAATCPDDPEVDLCDQVKKEVSGAVKLHASGANSLLFILSAALGANDVKSPAMAMLILPFVGVLPKAMAAKPETTCHEDALQQGSVLRFS
jgi:hypothetical protein